MGSITIKSPNSDVIWDTWKRKNVKKENLEKNYKVKGSVFNVDAITAAEFVKGVDKAAIIFFIKTNEIKPESDKPKKVLTEFKKVSKEKFFEFKTSPKKAEWKYNELVPFFTTLSPQNCDKCGGKGAVPCGKCDAKGLVTCPDCGGKQKSCKECNGSGKLSVSISVINDDGDKTKKDLTVKCNACFGAGTLKCGTCGGTGKVPCSYCKGSGVYSCPSCDGYGVMYKYEIRPVPFKQEKSSAPVLLTSIKLSGLEKQIGEDILDTIDDVEGILINNPHKQLDKKYIEPSLGYIDKDIQKMIKASKKEWKAASSDKTSKITLPIYLFPVFVLNCETRKGKKFQVYAIGSENKYKVYGHI